MLAPKTEAELAESVASADAPLSIRGGGTRGLATDGTPLTTSGLSGITLYEPGALTIVAKAGTPVAEIEAALAAENQMLAFEPMDHRTLLGTTGEPTIGGVVATNTSGPRRVQAGACRDFLLGVRFVDGSGTVIKNGGRVMKNVTGYDLSRLMCGAHGTLGVLTEVSLKVLPRPATTGSLTLSGLPDDQALSALSVALNSPYEVSGAVHHRGLSGQDTVTMIRVEGFENSVRYRLEELQKRLGDFGAWSVSTDNQADGWRWARDLEMFKGETGDIWRLSLKPTDAPGIVASLQAEDVFYDWGGGQAFVRVPEGKPVRSRMNGVSGHATLIRGTPAAEPRFHPEADPLAKLAAGLRQKYDPKGILNPGLMG